MPQIQSQHDQANLGWLYYKNYFRETNAQDTLAGRNHAITQRSFSNSEAFLHTKPKHGFPLYTTYPGLLIGSGYTHEYGEGTDKNDAFKIGFFFDYVTGLPCIPGHGVKGALRASFPNHRNEKYKMEKAEFIVALLGGEEMCKAKFDKYIADNKLDKIDYTHQVFALLLGQIVFEGNKPVSFKNNQFEFEQIPLSAKDVFHDAYIASGGNEGLFLANDYITPHTNPLKDPVPIQFLKILPSVGVQFQFDLKDNLILASEKEALFRKIILAMGVGAKTNVGYGQFMTTEVYKEFFGRAAQSGDKKSPPDKPETVIPIEMSSKLVKGEYKGKVTNVTDKYIMLNLTIGKYSCQLVKKRDKNPTITGPVDITIRIDKDYKYGDDLIFKIL